MYKKAHKKEEKKEKLLEKMIISYSVLQLINILTLNIASNDMLYYNTKKVIIYS